MCSGGAQGDTYGHFVKDKYWYEHGYTDKNILGRGGGGGIGAGLKRQREYEPGKGGIFKAKGEGPYFNLNDGTQGLGGSLGRGEMADRNQVASYGKLGSSGRNPPTVGKRKTMLTGS